MTAEVKHTPGPWSLGTSDEHPNYVEAADPFSRGHNNLVAICETFSISDDMQHVANARLIAAAPDLLRALTDLVEMNGQRDSVTDELLPADAQSDEEISDAMDAIDRATGAA